MAGRFERVRSTARAVVYEIRSEDVTFMAASIAYHAFVSLLPILVLLTLVASAVGSEGLIGRIFELTGVFLPPATQGVVENALTNADGSVGASVVGVVVLLWATTKVFRAMDAAFSEIFDTKRRNTVLNQARDTVVVAATLVTAALVAVFFGSWVSVPPTVPFSGVLDGLVATAGLAVAFTPMYYVFPDMDVSIREVVPGVVVAAAGWTVLQSLFRLYVQASSKTDVYGFVGTVLLLVTWLYVGSLLLLVGAAVNSTLAGRAGDRPPEPGGRSITDADSFEDRLDLLVSRARDADVADEEIDRALRRQVEADGPKEDQAAEKRPADQPP